MFCLIPYKLEYRALTNKIFKISMKLHKKKTNQKLFAQEEKVYAGSTESFGKQWGPGDVVGVFLDLVDHTISKTMN